jgi:hypothetical protein
MFSLLESSGYPNITIDIGSRAIYIPAPVGFYEISQLSPETRKFAETSTPQNNRLLAVFVSESDLGRIMKGELPEFGRYMFLQVRRQLENSDISGAKFLQMVGQFKQQQDTLLKNVKDKVGSMLDEASEKILTDYDVSLKLKVGEQVPLGIFIETNEASGFASLAKYQVSSDAQQLDYLMATGTSLIWVKGKILYAYVYGSYDTPKDLDWVRATSCSWIDQILMANIEKGHLTASADVPRQPLAGAGLFIAFAIAYLSRRRAIGGWLLYFYIQLYLGLAASLIFVPQVFSNLNPSQWDNSFLYVMFFLSGVPVIATELIGFVAATKLLFRRNEQNVKFLRQTLIVLVATSL